MRIGGHGKGVLAMKSCDEKGGPPKKAPLSDVLEAGVSPGSRSIVICVGLLIPAVELAADREHYLP